MIKEENIYNHSLVMLLIVLLNCACIYKVNAQNYINKTYVADRSVMLFGSVLLDDTSYILTGVTNDTPNTSLAKSIIARINSEGEMVGYKSFVDSNNALYGVFTNTLLKNSTGQYVFAGYSYTSLAYMVLGIANENFDSISIFRYYTPNIYAYHGYDLVQHIDGCYYISGVRSDSLGNNPNAVIVKIDSAGNRLWERHFGTPRYDESKSLVSLNNGNLMMGCNTNDFNQNNEKANTWLIEVDTGGNIVRQWLDNNDSTYAAEGLLQTQDGGFVYGAQRKGRQYFNTIYWYSSIVKLDSSFNKQWEYRDYNISGYSGVYDVEELPDGSIIACGNRTDEIVDYLGGWIIKLSPTGEVLWNRLYQGLTMHNAQNFLSDVDILPDGSLVAVGQCQQPNAPRQVGWLLKVDSNGCEIENCVVGIDDIESSQLLKVYPNPATDRLMIELPESNESNKVYINSITGESIAVVDVPLGATQVEVNTANFAVGVYLARINNQTRKFIIVN